MPVGSPGVESFRDIILEFRNRDILGAMYPLVNFRKELVADDEFQNRGGIDDPAVLHFSEHLLMADKLRRYITHNPEGGDLHEELANAIDPEGTLAGSQPIAPFVGEAVQNASRGLALVPWAFDGTDPDIPMMSALRLDGAGLLLLGSLDMCLVLWTRLHSRQRTRKITLRDSYRIYAEYSQLYGVMKTFMGDANRVDIAQVLPSEEPRGLVASPNFRVESAGGSPSASRTGPPAR